MSISLRPETLEEVALLFRFSNNYKKTTPDVYMSFSRYNTDKAPYCNVSMPKVRPTMQVNSISNKKS